MNRIFLVVFCCLICIFSDGCVWGNSYDQGVSIQSNVPGYTLGDLTVSGLPMTFRVVNRKGADFPTVNGELQTGQETIIPVDAWAGTQVKLKMSVFDPIKAENNGYVGFVRTSIYVEDIYRGHYYSRGYQVEAPDPWIINLNDIEWASKPK